jgi:PAS domain S-box-containing protein
MITRFQRLPVKTKLIVVMVATAIVALLLPTAAMLINELVRMREASIQRFLSQAQIVGISSSAALAFDDQPAAEEVLGELKKIPDIAAASLFDKSGVLFARYVAKGSTNENFLGWNVDSGETHFENGYLIVRTPIFLREDFVGTIALVGDLRQHRNQMVISASIMFTALCAALLIAVLLSARLQRLISEPVLGLADVARRITVNKDYSLRAKSDHRDEIGTLVTDFNEMLAEIERRDSQLRTSEERFRQLAETIREVFWLTDPDKAATLYVSPSYQEIWGRSCERLYHSPLDWVEAIHPDDRDRICNAALTKQSAGDYDEEYRIIRPDGTMRWIHDRAFPIRDANGRVYRIAGIAEDITMRKQLEKQILEISDREQSRFGQDLHDGLCQHLVRIGFASNVLHQDLEKQGHPETARARKIATLVDDAITHSRNLARGLYPVKLETEGLRSALEEMAALVVAQHAIDARVQWPAKHQIADHTVAIHLYRIVQEAVANAVKHADARCIVIGFREEGELRLQMTIRDDGTGITAKGSTGMGLHIMKYRARMISAALDVQSQPGGGTIVSCTFNVPFKLSPLTEQEPTNERI